MLFTVTFHMEELCHDVKELISTPRYLDIILYQLFVKVILPCLDIESLNQAYI